MTMADIWCSKQFVNYTVGPVLIARI